MSSRIRRKSIRRWERALRRRRQHERARAERRRLNRKLAAAFGLSFVVALLTAFVAGGPA